MLVLYNNTNLLNAKKLVVAAALQEAPRTRGVIIRTTVDSSYNFYGLTTSPSCPTFEVLLPVINPGKSPTFTGFPLNFFTFTVLRADPFVINGFVDGC